MSEVGTTEAASDLDAIAAEAWALEPPISGRRGLLGHEAAIHVDRLLTRIARGRGALDIAIGEGLLALGIGDRTLEDGLEPLMELLEQETAQWALLERPNPVLAPVAGAAVETDSSLLDAELRRLASLRARWDDVFGHLAMLMQTLGLWRDAGFASFGHYCSERLRMSERTVGQRIALERRLRVLPLLRQAMREGRISYEKARLVAWQADDTTVEEIIGVAEAMTCIDLRRKIEAEEEEQMCARGDFDFRAPRGVGALLSTAFSAARKEAGEWIPPAECLRRIAQHFIDTWETALKEPSTPQRRILARDRGFCRCRAAAAPPRRPTTSSSGRRAAATIPRISSASVPRITCKGCTRAGSGSAAWRPTDWNGSSARAYRAGDAQGELATCSSSTTPHAASARPP